MRGDVEPFPVGDAVREANFENGLAFSDGVFAMGVMARDWWGQLDDCRSNTS